MRYLFMLMCLLSIKFCHAQADTSLLLKAYVNKSDKQLEQFINQWYRESKLIPALKSPFSDTAQLMVNEFYKTETLKTLNEWVDYDSLYRSTDYMVLPSEINVHQIIFPDSIPTKGSLLFTLTYIKPSLSFINKKVLYLNAKYANMINRFLLTDERKHTESEIKALIKERQKRSDFLKKVLKLHFSSWGFTPLIQSCPYILSLAYSKAKHLYMVEYAPVFGGRSLAFFRFENNKLHHLFSYRALE